MREGFGKMVLQVGTAYFLVEPVKLSAGPDASFPRASRKVLLPPPAQLQAPPIAHLHDNHRA